MASNMKVRPLRAADEPQWQALFRGYLQFYNTKPDETVMESTFHGMLSADQTLRCWVADINGKAVGMAHVILHPSTWSQMPDAYLNDLFTAPDYRKHGVGRALLQEVINTGHEEGWRKLYWNTAADNESAKRLYRKVAKETSWVKFEVGY